jgi:hypothetical protein
MKDIFINGTWHTNLPDIVVDTITAQNDELRAIAERVRTMHMKEHTAIVKRTKAFRLAYYDARQDLYAYVGCSVKQGELLK